MLLWIKPKNCILKQRYATVHILILFAFASIDGFETQNESSLGMLYDSAEYEYYSYEEHNNTLMCPGCIPKCCPENEAFSLNQRFCKRNLMVPKVFMAAEGKRNVIATRMHFLQCGSNGLFKTFEHEKIEILSNGFLHIKSYPFYYVNNSQYCVDFFQNDTEEHYHHFAALICNNVRFEQNWVVSNLSAQICAHNSSETFYSFIKYLRYFYTACGLLSIISLIITTTVFIAVPNSVSSNVMYKMIVAGNTSTMMVTTLLLLLAYYAIPSVDNDNDDKTRVRQDFGFVIGQGFCSILGYSLYFFSISMFIWMSLLCYYMTSMFMGRPRSKAFFRYNGVAWGAPILLTLGLLVYDYYVDDSAVGINICFLPMTQGLYFFYIPVMFIIIINIIMYCMTARIFYKMKKHIREVSKVIPGDESQVTNHELREHLTIYSKLFFLMGITWLLECIHRFVHGDHSKGCDEFSTESVVEIVFRLFGAINLLRGFFFMIIFVCKSSVWTSMKKSYIKYLAKIRQRKSPFPSVAEEISFNTRTISLTANE